MNPVGGVGALIEHDDGTVGRSSATQKVGLGRENARDVGDDPDLGLSEDKKTPGPFLEDSAHLVPMPKSNEDQPANPIVCEF